jgi:3-hydroxyisobutyrate dehydrogenase-like beta-hydroxyacid dehydrogenase
MAAMASTILLPPRPVVGIAHPGAMGAALGAALKPVAGQVIWAEHGRSHATAKRAELADLVAVPDLASLARRCDLVISICPPHAALDVAREVAAAGDRCLYLDANAVSPDTVHRIGALFGADRVVDGSVIGPPAWRRGDAVLWLSGRDAAAVAALFDDSPFVARVLGTELGAASGLKVCFALQSKALPTIWLEIAEAARAFGVQDALRDELGRHGVDLDDTVATITRKAADRAWRWAGEMDEAADAIAALGLPDGFSRAAAQLYRSVGTPDPTG